MTVAASAVNFVKNIWERIARLPGIYPHEYKIFIEANTMTYNSRVDQKRLKRTNDFGCDWGEECRACAECSLSGDNSPTAVCSGDDQALQGLKRSFWRAHKRDLAYFDRNKTGFEERQLEELEEERLDSIPEEDMDARVEELEALAAIDPKITQIVQWTKEGYSMAEIAKKLGISRQGLSKWLKELFKVDK